MPARYERDLRAGLGVLNLAVGCSLMDLVVALDGDGALDFVTVNSAQLGANSLVRVWLSQP